MDSPLQLTFGERNAAYLSAPQDYRKQRVKVARRVHRLKKYLKIQCKNTRKYQESAVGPEQYAQDEKYQLLVLLQSEKDCLFALELKAVLELSEHSSKSKQRLMATRLKKAGKLSGALAQMSAGEPNNTKRLEILVYNELVHGYLGVLGRKYERAITHYSNARVALKCLEAHGSNSELYRDIVEDVIDFNLGLAVYKSRGLESIDLNEFTKKHADAASDTVALVTRTDPAFLELASQVEHVTSVAWRNFNASVKDEVISKKLHELGLEGADIDSRLSLWQDVLSIHQENLAKDLENDENDLILLSYINYNLLVSRVERDYKLVRGLFPASLTQALKIYDNIIATIGEIIELPGVYSDDELSANLESLNNFFKLSKEKIFINHFIGEKQYKKALYLANQAADKFTGLKITLNDGNFIITNDHVQQLSLEYNNFKKMSYILLSSNNNALGQQFSLDKFNSNLNIFDLKLSSVQIKPVLFDIAFNYISYGHESAPVPAPAMQHSQNQNQPEKKRFFGLFGGQ